MCLRGGGIPVKRKLSKDLSMSELLELRAEGMTNKQIAEQLGVSVSTVYNYIGRRSQAVKYAEVQNKPCPVLALVVDEPNPLAERKYIPKEFEIYEEMSEVEAPIGLPIINERQVYDLQGTACTFTVDTGSDCVVIGEDENSLIKGIIQINSIPKLILELQQIMDIVDESKKGIVLKKMQA